MSSAGWQLLQVGPGHHSAVWELTGSLVRVGRSEDCEIRLESEYVARHHVRLRWEAAARAWMLEPRMTPSDVELNGDLVREPRPLRPRDRILVGDVVLVLEHEPTVEDSDRTSPLPTLRRPLAEGTLFEIWEADLAGRDVCVKRTRRGPTATDAGSEVFLADWSICFSRLVSLIGHSGRIARQPPTEELLAGEADRIRTNGAAWHHQVLALSTLADGTLAIVMPRYDAVRFDALPPNVQRTILPRLLPLLWDALADAPHGDLQPGNLLVEAGGSSFHLIDPCAGIRRSELLASPDSRQELLFTTTPSYYPLLPPYHAARISLAEGHGLEDHHEDFLRGLSMASRPFAAGEHTTGVAFTSRGVGIGAKVNLCEPHPADLQALGILYYEALVDRHPFFDDAFPSPDWLGGRVEDQYAVGFDAARDRVTRPVVPPSAIDPQVSAAEDRLALALLHLAVPSRDALVEWAAATS